MISIKKPSSSSFVFSWFLIRANPVFIAHNRFNLQTYWRTTHHYQKTIKYHKNTNTTVRQMWIERQLSHMKQKMNEKYVATATLMQIELSTAPRNCRVPRRRKEIARPNRDMRMILPWRSFRPGTLQYTIMVRARKKREMKQHIIRGIHVISIISSGS